MKQPADTATAVRPGAAAPRERPHPHFNHVALSLPASSLDETGRSTIVAFYSEVFGWQELPTMTVDRQRLVLQVYTYNQFVFLISDDEPMAAPRLDHFGMQVSSMDELDGMLDRCRAYAGRDGRVDIIDKKAEVHPGLTITSFYVRYLLPMMVEVQLFEANDTRESAR